VNNSGVVEGNLGISLTQRRRGAEIERKSSIIVFLVFSNEVPSFIHELPSFIHELLSFIHELPSFIHELPSLIHELPSLINELLSFINELPRLSILEK
jgi:hypothetical protein